MNLLDAIADLTDLRREECLVCTESWEAWRRRTILSATTHYVTRDLTIKSLENSDGRKDYIYADLRGFPSLPAGSETEVGAALWTLASELADDTHDNGKERTSYIAKKTSTITAALPSFQRADLRRVNLNEYQRPLGWGIYEGGVMARKLPSLTRKPLYEVDLHGLRTIISQESIEG